MASSNNPCNVDTTTKLALDKVPDIFYEIHNLAANLAVNTINNYIHDFDLDLIERNLQNISFYHVIKDLDFVETPIASLSTLRFKLLNQMYVSRTFDTIKCFLRLMTCKGVPTSIDYDTCDLCYRITECVNFADFKIYRKFCICDRHVCSVTTARVAINVTFAKLLTILRASNLMYFNDLMCDGDVESNPGPVQSRFAKSELGSGFVAQSLFDVDHKVTLGVDANITQFIDTLSSQIPNAVTQTKEYLSTACKLFLILRNLNDITAISVTFIDLLLTWNVPMKIASSAWTWVSEHCSALFGLSFRAQVASPVNTTALTMLMTCVCGLLGSQKLPCKSLITTVLKSLGDVGRATQGYRTLSECFAPIFNSVYKTVYLFIFGVPPDESDLESMLSDIKVWFEDVNKLIPLCKQDAIPTDYKTVREVERIYTKGLMFMRQIDMLKLSPPDREPFLKYWMIMQKIYDRTIAQGVRKSEPRTEPVIIHLFGSSGVGKSGLVYLLAQDLCAEEGLSDETMDETYFRNVEQEFWDGYHGQMVCVYDDFGQMVDSQGAPNPEFMEIVRCRNIAPWPLHMAHLEDKARTRFTSRAIILTSNESHYVTPSLTHPEAFQRRLDISAKVKIRSKYLIPDTQRLDPDSVSKALDPDVYLFCLHKDNKPERNSKGEEIWMSYSEFSKLCVRKYSKMYASSKKRLNCLRERSVALKLRAQVRTPITADRAIQATLWLTARDKLDPTYQRTLVDEGVLSHEQAEALLALACSADDYFDFMALSVDYCLSQFIDLLKPVDSDLDYIALHNKIYDMKLTDNKRVGPSINYVDAMFNRLRDTIVSCFHSIKETAARNYITFGSIAVGVVAIYGLKQFFSPSEKKSNHSKPLKPIRPRTVTTKPDNIPFKCSQPKTESRELEKRKPLRLTAEKCLFAESRIEEKRRPKRPVAEFLFSSKPCTCNTDEISSLCMPHIRNASFDFVKTKDNCVKDSLCWDCFMNSDLFVGIIDPLIERNRTPCFHDAADVQSSVCDALERDFNFRSEAAIDVNAQEMRYGPIAYNIYRIRTLDSSQNWRDRVNGVFIRGRLLLTVRHVLSFLGEDCLLVNPNNIDGIAFKFSECKVIPLTNSRGQELDAILIELPRSCNAHKDIVSQFSLQEDLSKFTEVPGNLPHLRYIGGKSRMFVYNNFCLPSISAIDSLEYTLDDIDGSTKSIQLREGYLYHAETSSGDCGAPLIASANSLTRKIIGIHVAGISGQAIAVHITQGMINRALKKASFEAQIKLDIPYSGDCIVPEGNFMPIGKYTQTLPRPTKTELRPSPLHGLVKEPFKKPASLKPLTVSGVRVDPLMIGLKKCGVSTPTLDNSILRRCRIALTSFLKKNRKNSHIGVLTTEQSIAGIPGDDFITPVKRRSSPGIPWCFQAGGTAGKRKWLGEGEDYILDHPDLISSLQKRYELACKGERMETIWADTLKDELRPIEKVDAGKTRVFSAGPMDFVIFMRQYYLPFFAHMMRNRIHNFCGVGINATGLDWEVLTKKLKSKGSKVAAGDFKNFDGTELAEILWACCDIICDVEDEPGLKDNDINRNIRKVIFCEIVNSIHLHGNNVYGWNHSLTSGNPGTAVINTLYNVLSMMYVFCKVTTLSPSSFFEHVYMVAYGDDNIINMSDAIAPVFNQVTISRGYADIGMEYTDEDKTGVVVPYRTIDNISFLKRKFRYDSDLCRHVAPLDLDTILEMTMWVRGDLDHKARCALNIEHAYRELALHGREIFEHWSVILDQLAHMHLSNPPILYDFIDYLGKEFEW